MSVFAKVDFWVCKLSKLPEQCPRSLPHNGDHGMGGRLAEASHKSYVKEALLMWFCENIIKFYLLYLQTPIKVTTDIKN